MEHIAPVLGLPALRSLKLHHALVLDLSRQDAVDIAKAFPHMRRLSLNPTPPTLNTHNGAPMELLVALGWYCPNLTHLRVFLATDKDWDRVLVRPKPLDCAHLTSLQMLNVGMTPCPKDPSRIMSQLAVLLPLSTEIDSSLHEAFSFDDLDIDWGDELLEVNAWKRRNGAWKKLQDSLDADDMIELRKATFRRLTEMEEEMHDDGDALAAVQAITVYVHEQMREMQELHNLDEESDESDDSGSEEFY
jgi:hypothetical protein